jgi:glycosyltransferase involved in cell wall biosynthesis
MRARTVTKTGRRPTSLDDMPPEGTDTLAATSESTAVASQTAPAAGRKLISIITPVYNEELTVQRCYEEVRRVTAGLADRYDYEHIFADNCSEDRTMEILRGIAASDPKVKVLAYSRNFGAEKSAFTAYRHASGDACIGVGADLQEPPAMIPAFLERWEEGYEIVYGIYENKSDNPLMALARKFYYWLVDRLSDERLPRGYNGFGVMDRKAVDELVKIDDHSPYLRGLIASLGFRTTCVPYVRMPRQAGESKHRVPFLLEVGLNGIINHSVVPIRLATLAGIALAGLAIFMAFGYVVMKLINWQFQAPGATTTIAFLLFFSGVQLFFLGMLGEYIAAIHSQVRRKPFVIIRERINFPADEGNGR